MMTVDARLGAVILAIASVVGCDDPSMPPRPPIRRWECPSGWTTSPVGGCGPKAWVCDGDGASSAGCDAAGAPATDGSELRRLADGGIGGAWFEPGDPDGPPTGERSPVAESPCPTGWTRAEDGWCAPSLSDDCGPRGGALPDGRCLDETFAACPSGAFPSPPDLPDGARVVYVRAGAAAGGDGTAERPYATIRDALLAPATSRAWILLAAGQYREESAVSVIGEALHVVGACADRVTVVGARIEQESNQATFYALGTRGALDLRGVTVSGERVGLYVGRGASARASGVRFERNRRAAVVAVEGGTRVDMEDSLIVGTRPTGADDGMGVDVELGAALTMRRVRVVANTNVGVSMNGARGPVTATLDEVVIEGTLRSATRERGWGVLVDRGSAEVTRSWVGGNEGVELMLRGSDTRASLTDVRVAGARSPESEALADGVQVQSGAALAARGVVVEGHVGTGIAVANEGSRLEMNRCAVRGQSPERDGPSGNGLDVQGGASAALTEVMFVANAGVSVVASGEGSVVELSDAVVRGAPTPPRPGVHSGLQAQHGGAITARRTLVEGFTSHGAQAYGEGSRLALESSVVRDIVGTGGEQSGFGFGALARLGGAVQARGVLFERCAGISLLAGGDGSRLTVEGCAVRHTLPRWEGLWGRAVEVTTGRVSLEVSHTLLEDSVEAGVFLAESGVEARLDDVWIVGVRPGTRGLGCGVMAFAGARLTASRLAISDVAGAAVLATPIGGRGDAVATLEDAFIRRVRLSTVRFNDSDRTARPVGPTVAFGLHPAAGSTITGRRVVIDTGGAGFFNEGTLRMEVGVIARQGDFGAIGPGVGPTATVLVDVASVDNAQSGLPSRAGLPPQLAGMEHPTDPEVPLIRDAGASARD